MDMLSPLIWALLGPLNTPGHRELCKLAATPTPQRREACHWAVYYGRDNQDFYHFAQAYYQMGDLNKAQNALSKTKGALSLQAATLQARIFAKTQRMMWVEKAFDGVAAPDIDKLRQLAEVYTEFSETQLAKRALQRALEKLDLGQPSGQIDAANVYLQLARLYSEPAQALEMIEKAVKMWPSPVTYWARLEHYSNHQQTHKLADELENIIQLDPLNYRYYRLRAQLAQARGDLSQTLNDLILAHKLIQDEPDFQFNIHKINQLTDITKDITRLYSATGWCHSSQYVYQSTCQLTGKYCHKVNLNC